MNTEVPERPVLLSTPDTDWDLSNVSVVILGAGFSAACTDGRTPLMNSFFSGIDEHQYELLSSFVRDAEGTLASANVENVLLLLEQMRKSPDKALAGWGQNWASQYREIKLQLTRYTCARLRISLEVAPNNWAAGVLSTCGPATTVISLNYDNIAERILSNRKGMTHGNTSADCPHCKMRTMLYKACNCISRSDITDDDWRGSLIKPHGSIAWKRCTNPACCSYECLVADERCRPFDPCNCPYCNQECAPVMVLPSISKDLSETREIAVMWQAARSAIEAAESILIFGFSLPLSDALFVHLLKKSLCHSRNLKKLAVVDLNPLSVVERFEKCVPANGTVEVSPFTVLPGTVPAWLKDRP